MKIFSLLFMALLSSTSAWSAERCSGAFSDPYWDEIFLDRARSRVRVHYRDVIDITGLPSAGEIAQFKAMAKKRYFDGDNGLYILPRVLSAVEHDRLINGAKQRFRALQLFLKDHYSGRKRYAEAGIVPASVVDRLIDRNHERQWQSRLRAKHFEHLWYGPDMIRDPRGNPRVLEDNFGFIGGPGDLIAARQAMFDKYPRLADLNWKLDPLTQYRMMIDYYRSVAKRYSANGQVVMIQYANGIRADNEEVRVEKLMKKLGVEVVILHPDQKSENQPTRKRLVKRADGMYLEYNSEGVRRRRKVGFIINNVEPVSLGKYHSGNFDSDKIREEAEYQIEMGSDKSDKIRELLRPDPITGLIDFVRLNRYLKNYSDMIYPEQYRVGYPDVLDAFLNGQIGLANPPGLDFVQDKEFYLYVDDLVRFYLGEEPGLTNIETGRFAKLKKSQNGSKNWVVDNKSLDHVLKNISKYVIKGVGGRGGDAVWVGPKLRNPSATAQELGRAILLAPEEFIWQRYTPLSRLQGLIVDTRAILYSEGPRSKVLGLWGRGLPLAGNGKVNLSDQGVEVTVLSRDE